jgi:hypothetical protein
MARTASTPKPSGKRNGIREHRAQRAFSPIDLLNLWEPTGAWEEYRGLAYGEGPRQKLDVYSGTNPDARGRMILISVNSPGRVSTSIEPPCCLTTMS